VNHTVVTLRPAPIPTMGVAVTKGASARDLEAVCLRCLAKRPEDRYATAAELVLALEACRDRPPTGRRAGRVAAAVVAGGAVAAGLAAAGGWVGAGPRGDAPPPAGDAAGPAPTTPPAERVAGAASTAPAEAPEDAALALGRDRLARGQRAAALVAFAAARAAAPGSDEAARALEAFGVSPLGEGSGCRYAWRPPGDPAAAVERAELAFEVAPGDPERRLALATALGDLAETTREPASARAAAGRAFALLEGSAAADEPATAAAARVERARLALVGRDLDAVAPELDAAERLLPGLVLVPLLRAAAALRRRDAARALALLDGCLDRAGGAPAEALLWRAAGRLQAGAPAEALVDLERLIALDGGDVRARALASVAALELGDVPRSVDPLRGLAADTTPAHAVQVATTLRPLVAGPWPAPPERRPLVLEAGAQLLRLGFAHYEAHAARGEIFQTEGRWADLRAEATAFIADFGDAQPEGYGFRATACHRLAVQPGTPRARARELLAEAEADIAHGLTVANLPPARRRWLERLRVENSALARRLPE